MENIAAVKHKIGFLFDDDIDRSFECTTAKLRSWHPVLPCVAEHSPLSSHRKQGNLRLQGSGAELDFQFAVACRGPAMDEGDRRVRFAPLGLGTVKHRASPPVQLESVQRSRAPHGGGSRARPFPVRAAGPNLGGSATLQNCVVVVG